MGDVKVYKKSGVMNDIRAYNPARNFTLSFNDVNAGTKAKKDQQKQKLQNAKSRGYPLNSYTWSDDYVPRTVTDDDLNPVQKMIITEFQPDFKFEWGKLSDIGVSVLEKFTPKMISDTAKKLAVEGVKALKLAEQVQNQYQSSPEKVVGLPIDFIKGLFNGTYLSTFEIPFFSETYLEADTTGNWSAGGSQKAIGEKLASIMQEAMSVNFPTTPTWQISDTGSRKAFEVEFYLINNSDKSLFNNFQLINALCSGMYWTQMDFVQKSPNVYDIEVPGRFHIYFAALGFEVTHVGKLRTNNNVGSQLGKTYKSINTGTLWPDAWKFKLNVQDLSPNNFNNYVDYLKLGKDGNISVGMTVENNINYKKGAAEKTVGALKQKVTPKKNEDT